VTLKIQGTFVKGPFIFALQKNTFTFVQKNIFEFGPPPTPPLPPSEMPAPVLPRTGQGIGELPPCCAKKNDIHIHIHIDIYTCVCMVCHTYIFVYICAWYVHVQM